MLEMKAWHFGIPDQLSSLLAPFAQDLLAAPASQAYVERVFTVCGHLTAGKRNHLCKKLANRA